MAKLRTTRRRVPYLELSCTELLRSPYSGFPICAKCSKDLMVHEELILIPILRGVYCRQCGWQILRKIKRSREERTLEKRSVNFYKEQFGIKR